MAIERIFTGPAGSGGEPKGARSRVGLIKAPRRKVIVVKLLVCLLLVAAAAMIGSEIAVVVAFVIAIVFAAAWNGGQTVPRRSTIARG